MGKVSDLRNVPISAIRENPVALRGVDREEAEYISLRDSVSKHGIQLPITVRAKSVTVEGQTEPEVIFEICDGLHRYSAAVDTGLETIPVNVIDADEATVLELQIMGNLCRVSTAHASYADQLKRMFNMNPTMTIGEMAEKVCQSPAWVSQRLSLTKLHDQVKSLVDDNTIGLANAYSMAKLPKDEQLNFIEQAITMQSTEFGPSVNERVKELRDAAKQGRAANPQEFAPTTHLRKSNDLKPYVDNPALGAELVATEGVTTALEGFVLGLKYALSLTTADVEKQRANYDARKAQREDERKKAALERANKAEKAAAEKAAKVRAEVGAV